MTLGVVLLSASSAFAEARLRVGLDYRAAAAPPDCPGETEVRAAVMRHLGYDPFVNAGETRDFELKIAIAQRGGTTDARLAWLGSDGTSEGERVLSSENPRCSELADALVFAIAVQLQLRANAQPPPAPPAPPAPRVLTEKRAPPPRPRPERAVLLGLGLFGRWGVQPGVAKGMRSFGLLRAQSWSVGLDVHATLPTTEPVWGNTSFSARELGLNVTPCWRRSVVDACALGFLGLLSVRGEGVDQVRTPSTALLGAGLRLQLVWPELERFATLAHLDVTALLTPRDVMLNYETAWSTAPISVALGFDLGAIFR